jgi:predicted dehydrogenase
MSDAPANPLLFHPAFGPVAAELCNSNVGQLLAVYLSGRTKRRDGDPLRDLGAPLLDYLLTVIDSPVASVTATNERVANQSPDAWFLTIRFADGLVATVDLGFFLPASYPTDTEVRLEICGTDRVLVVEPDNVAVTVIGRDGTRRDDAYPDPWNDLLIRSAAAISEAADRPVSRVIDAARRSAATGKIVFTT